MSPSEFIPFIAAKIAWRNKEMRIENERIGTICATLANIWKNPKVSKIYSSSDFFRVGDDEEVKEKTIKRDPQKIYDTMNLWCAVDDRAGDRSGT